MSESVVEFEQPDPKQDTKALYRDKPSWVKKIIVKKIINRSSEECCIANVRADIGFGRPLPAVANPEAAHQAVQKVLAMIQSQRDKKPNNT